MHLKVKLMKNQLSIRQLTFTALMTAVICVLAPFSIPVPVSESPISLGLFAIYLTALVLGWRLGTLSVFLYLLLGAVGVPVFTGWGAGIGKVLGPTGGYMIGYLFVSIIAGAFAERYPKKLVLRVTGLVIGTLVCYFFGTVWMVYSLGLSVQVAIAKAIVPFLIPDAIKMAAAVTTAIPLRRLFCHSNTFNLK